MKGLFDDEWISWTSKYYVWVAISHFLVSKKREEKINFMLEQILTCEYVYRNAGLNLLEWKFFFCIYREHVVGSQTHIVIFTPLTMNFDLYQFFLFFENFLITHISSNIYVAITTENHRHCKNSLYNI